MEEEAIHRPLSAVVVTALVEVAVEVAVEVSLDIQSTVVCSGL